MKIKKSVLSLALGALMHAGLTQADPTYPLDVYIKSIQVDEAHIYKNVFQTVPSLYLYYSEVLVVTLDSAIECESAQASNNSSFVTDKLLVVPNFITTKYSSNKDFTDDPSGDYNHQVTRIYQASVSMFYHAMLNKVPVTILNLDASGASTEESGDGNFCILNPQEAKLSAPPTGVMGGVVVAPGGTVPDPIQTTWGFNIPTAGNYQVYAHWIVAKNIVASAAYDFNASGTATNITVNPDFSAGIWVKLGDVRTFSAGQQSVELTLDQNGVYVVDGIKVEKVN